MSTAKTAGTVLAEAEAKLRELVGQAAGGGEYDLAVKLATLAKKVAELALSFDEPLPGRNPAAPMEAPPERPAPAVHQRARDVAPDSTARTRARRGVPRGSKRAGRSARGRAKGAYPKFFREGEYLVKVSWSKKKRAEYQHKAPRRVAELLAAAMARHSGNGRMFTSEDIFPLKDPHGGDVPSYQAYAALAWFRQCGLVQPHGRRGYTAKEHGRLSELLTATWEELSESRE